MALQIVLVRNRAAVRVFNLRELAWVVIDHAVTGADHMTRVAAHGLQTGAGVGAPVNIPCASEAEITSGIQREDAAILPIADDLIDEAGNAGRGVQELLAGTPRKLIRSAGLPGEFLTARLSLRVPVLRIEAKAV